MSTPARHPAGEDRPRGYGPSERLTAARLTHRHPHWLILWGPHSRCYFGFPLFSASAGMVITASGPGELTTQMRQAEAAFAARPRARPR